MEISPFCFCGAPEAVRTEFIEHKRGWLASDDFNIDELDDSLDEYLRE